jgi:23S rRNA (uracil1939-C5)-methyltransferase
LLGYHEKASHRLVDIRECPVLVAEIVAALPGLKARRSADAEARASCGHRPGDDRRSRCRLRQGRPELRQKIPQLSQLAVEMDLARLSVNGETLLEVRPPVLDMGGTAVVPPPGGFTQATLAAETALCRWSWTAWASRRKVADLFAGVRNLCAQDREIRLRSRSRRRCRRDQGAGKRSAHPEGPETGHDGAARPVPRPLMAEELNAFDAVVFDPPRAGAQAQAEQLALSRYRGLPPSPAIRQHSPGISGS